MFQGSVFHCPSLLRHNILKKYECSLILHSHQMLCIFSRLELRCALCPFMPQQNPIISLQSIYEIIANYH